MLGIQADGYLGGAKFAVSTGGRDAAGYDRHAEVNPGAYAARLACTVYFERMLIPQYM